MTANLPEPQPGKLRRGLSKSRFDLIFREGLRATGISARVLAAPGQGITGFASSKKIGNRPKRNRALRRMREALRMQPELVERGLDYVIVALEASAEVPYREICEELNALMKKVNERWAEKSASS